MSEASFAASVRVLLESLPPGVSVVGAAKSRTVEQVRVAIRGGVSCIGHNYVQEAEAMIPLIEEPVRWHMIGHLQRNKVKKAVKLFDVIETVDSWRLAEEIETRCAAIEKVITVLVEVNSGREASKTGVPPAQLEELVWKLSELPHVRVQGLMTMGPRFGLPENSRPYFRLTREAFDTLAAADIPDTEMRYLSMGMSNSYRVAIEEGANVVRLGSLLFGQRREE